MAKPTTANIALTITKSINSKRAKNHTCSIRTCTVKPYPVELHLLNGKYSLVHPYGKPLHGLSKKTFCEKVESLYICTDTGSIHHCHAVCEGEKILSNSMYVCSISGEQFDGESVMSWHLSARCHSTEQFKKGDPLKYSRDSSGKVVSATYNISRTEYMNIGREVIHLLLFSDKRWQLETEKSNETRRITDKQVQKYIRLCNKKNKVKLYTVMLNQYFATLNRRNMNSSQIIRKTKEEEEHIIEKLAAEVYSYWEMIIKYNSRAPSTHFNFKSFVSAILYLMKNGVLMKGKYVIKKNVFLDQALPESNKLDYYGISKPSFTSTKNTIQKIIREAFEKPI